MRLARYAPLLALLLGGCASPSPNLYSLEPRPGAVRASAVYASAVNASAAHAGPVLAGVRPGARMGLQAGARRVVVVRGVGLPRYLEREEIVRSAGGARLRVAENDWWGEPLRAMLRRVLVADLAQRLPGADVLADEGSIAAHPDAEVEMDVQRFDPDAPGPSSSGPVLLDGYAAVTTPAATGPGRPRTLDRLHLVVPVAAGTTKAQVDAMSAALGQAADAIAGRLAQ